MNAEEHIFDYHAFISYSRDDNKVTGRDWANWLKKRLEGFRVPQSCVGRETKYGPVPARLGQVFLDRSDMTAEGLIDNMLIDKISKSRFLLLVCSPRSAASKFVGLEIEQFIRCHGPHRVIRIVIAGEQLPGSAEPKVFNDALAFSDAAGGIQSPAGTNAIYIDFRVVEELPGGGKHIRDGWVEPHYYARQLAKEKELSSAKQGTLFRAYEREHESLYYTLVATLLGLTPRDIQEDDKRERLKSNRTKLFVALCVAGFAVVSTILICVFWFQANRARQKAERSLLMIGDAHESTSRLVSDVLVDLRAKLGGQPDLLEDAQKIVRAHLSENEPSGNDDDSLHMRSVVLNSRGYLARQLGAFDEAERHFAEALALRRDLARRNPKALLFEHNISLSLDNFGDLHAFKAEDIAAHGGDKRDEYARALVYYRDGLAISEKLAATPDSTISWQHDLAVSRFKVGAALFQGDDTNGALAELKRGLPVAEAVATSDPDYPKWQAHLGLYCLEIGSIHAGAGQFWEARPFLLRGHGIFVVLREKKRLTAQYAEWLARIEAVLKDIAE